MCMYLIIYCLVIVVFFLISVKWISFVEWIGCTDTPLLSNLHPFSDPFLFAWFPIRSATIRRSFGTWTWSTIARWVKISTETAPLCQLPLLFLQTSFGSGRRSLTRSVRTGCPNSPPDRPAPHSSTTKTIASLPMSRPDCRRRFEKRILITL